MTGSEITGQQGASMTKVTSFEGTSVHVIYDDYDQLFRNRAEESHSEGADKETESVSKLFRCEYCEEKYISIHLKECPRCSESVTTILNEDDLRLWRQ